MKKVCLAVLPALTIVLELLSYFLYLFLYYSIRFILFIIGIRNWCNKG